MNNYRNFLNESIYDINILKELKLGDSLNEEIFMEAKIAPTVTTKNGIKIYLDGVAHKGKATGTPPPALKDIKSLNNADIEVLIKSVIKESKSIGYSGVNITYNKKNYTDYNVLSDEVAKFTTPTGKKSEAKTAISSLHIIIGLNWLYNLKSYKDNPIITPDDKKHIGDIINTFHNKEEQNMIGSYYTLTLTTSEIFDLKHFYINAPHNSITVNDIDKFKTSLKTEIEKTYKI